ncbi:MAG: 3-dehydroquinate synthase [Acidobacteriota bacterium]
MKTVQVSLGDRSYEILIEAGLLNQVGELLEHRGTHPRIFMISNSHVFQLYGEDLGRQLSDQGYQVDSVLIPDGEQHKHLKTVEQIYTDLISQLADRSSTVIALGGGVTGDIAGFAAATLFRGIPYIQIPTTLLAQVDSAVGGKTGVNHPLGKNMIGAFYQPDLVCIDTDTLSSLPAREFQSGLYEVVKYGLICDPEFFSFFETHLKDIHSQIPSVLEEVVCRCCEIKAQITSQDEKENDVRRILNFGHTFGHALEAVTQYQRFTHGEAIAWGMLVETHLSRLQGLLDASTGDRIMQTIHRIGKLPPLDNISVESLLEAMKRDKKHQGEKIIFVLLEAIGSTVITGDVEEHLLTEAWKLIC